MQRFQKDGIEWLAFDHLSNVKRLKHAIFLRQLDFATPDTFSRMQELLHIRRYYQTYQCHGKEVVEVTEPFNERPRGDALLTNKLHATLLIKHADCQAAILYDPKHHALATVHAGWRGSALNIYKETIEKMKSLYGTAPADLLVGISPSLGPERAEFVHYRTELPESFWSFQIKPLHFDFWEISRVQLKEAGVLMDHIEIAGICTYTTASDFFSYRRGDKESGRHATIATLTP